MKKMPAQSGSIPLQEVERTGATSYQAAALVQLVDEDVQVRIVKVVDRDVSSAAGKGAPGRSADLGGHARAAAVVLRILVWGAAGCFGRGHLQPGDDARPSLPCPRRCGSSLACPIVRRGSGR